MTTFRLSLFQQLEDFSWKSTDMLAKFEHLHELMSNPEIPDNLHGAKLMIEDHNHVKAKVFKAPVEYMEEEGRRIMHRIGGASGMFDGRPPGEYVLDRVAHDKGEYECS
jgi:hypothetical protein